mmetsp:Transcript_112077/g.157148  ORF Transcript_112077/g.157148 Transcript_112077/m.157148 type:complete len:234 (-) Transcript_112077:1007-1708(-)
MAASALVLSADLPGLQCRQHAPRSVTSWLSRSLKSDLPTRPQDVPSVDEALDSSLHQGQQLLSPALLPPDVLQPPPNDVAPTRSAAAPFESGDWSPHVESEPALAMLLAPVPRPRIAPAPFAASLLNASPAFVLRLGSPPKPSLGTPVPLVSSRVSSAASPLLRPPQVQDHHKVVAVQPHRVAVADPLGVHRCPHPLVLDVDGAPWEPKEILFRFRPRPLQALDMLAVCSFRR